jgi:FkbM family methyltransferase
MPKPNSDFSLKCRVIFDCGGYDGEWANKMALMYPSASIYIFEVVPAYCASLKERFNANKNIHVFDFGLGKSDGYIDIAVYGVASSAFLTHKDTKLVTGRIKKFGSFIHEHNLHQIDLLKMNIEGGEYDL